jgi:hypothetical protein
VGLRFKKRESAFFHRSPVIENHKSLFLRRGASSLSRSIKFLGKKKERGWVQIPLPTPFFSLDTSSSVLEREHR